MHLLARESGICLEPPGISVAQMLFLRLTADGEGEWRVELVRQTQVANVRRLESGTSPLYSSAARVSKLRSTYELRHDCNNKVAGRG